MSLDENETGVDSYDDLDVDTNDNQFVTFHIAGEIFAAPMAPVQEIIRMPELAHVPLAPPSLLGLANLRGRILPIIDLRRIFGLPQQEANEATRALVINLGVPMGLVVDRVASVMSVDKASIEPATSMGSIVDARLLTGVVKQSDGNIVMILDFTALIESEFRIEARKQETRSETLVDGPEHDREQVAEADADEIQLVSFRIDGQEFAADIATVQEIVQMPERVAAIPNAPGQVIGLMTLRERLLPLISLRRLLGFAETEVSESQRIVVLSLEDEEAVGVVADSVDEVLRVPSQLAENLPAILAQKSGLDEITTVCRLDGGKRLVSVLDTARLLSQEKIRQTLETMDHMEDEMRETGAEDEGHLSEDEEQVVVFRLGNEEFGVAIDIVQEIVRVPETLTHVPKAPPFVEGVINLRGAVLPVIDQRRRLNLEAIERNDRQRIMVYAIDEVRTGFIVDSVTEVLKIPRSTIEAAPKLSEDQHRIMGRVANLEKQKRMIMLMNHDALLSDAELCQLAAG